MYQKDFPFMIVLYDVKKKRPVTVSMKDFLMILEKYRGCEPDPETKK